MRKANGVRLVLVLAGVFLAPVVVWADNCSSPGDCLETAGYNAAMALGGGLLGLSAALYGRNLANGTSDSTRREDLEPYPTGEEALPEIDTPGTGRPAADGRPDLVDRGKYHPRPAAPTPAGDDLHVRDAASAEAPSHWSRPIEETPVDPTDGSERPKDTNDTKDTPAPSDASDERPLQRGIEREQDNLQRALDRRNQLVQSLAKDAVTAWADATEKPPTPEKRKEMIARLADDVAKALDHRNYGEAISKSGELVGRVLGGRDPRADIAVKAGKVAGSAGAVVQDLGELYQAQDQVEDARQNLGALEAKSGKLAQEQAERAAADKHPPKPPVDPPKPPPPPPPPPPRDDRELDKAVFEELPKHDGVPADYRRDYQPPGWNDNDVDLDGKT